MNRDTSSRLAAVTLPGSGGRLLGLWRGFGARVDVELEEIADILRRRGWRVDPPRRSTTTITTGGTPR